MDYDYRGFAGFPLDNLAPVPCTNTDHFEYRSQPLELRNTQAMGGKGTGSSPPLEDVFFGPYILNDTVSVNLPSCDQTRFRTLGRAARGDPLAVEGGFARMLYFSATTLTTLGYGDIVPTTDRARLWVMAEVLYGVVMAGLLLWSLANRLGRPRSGAVRDGDSEPSE